MSDIRSFSMKKNRLSAAEVRKKVLEGSYIANNQLETFDPHSFSTSNRLVLPEVANPIDVEEALSSRVIARTEIHATNSSPQRIRDLTEKDVDIVTIKRTKLFETGAIAHAENVNVEGHVKDLVLSYEKDFTVVERKYGHLSAGESYCKMASTRCQLAEVLNKQVFENDAENESLRIPLRSVSQVGDHPEFNRLSTASVESSGSSGSKEDSQSQQLHSSTCDPILPNVTQRISAAQVDEVNEKKRGLNRSPCLVNLLPLEPESEVIEKRAKLEPPTTASLQRLVVKTLKFSLDPMFEPIFGSAAIYDVNEKKKISENFYFDVNSEYLLSLVRGHLGIEEESSKCRQGMFNITDVKPGLFLIFKFEKILQGADISDAVDPYLREEKNVEKLSSQAREYCEKLGAYRMPFAWAALDLNNVLSNAAAMSAAGLNESLTRIEEEFESLSGSYHGAGLETESIISADRFSTVTSGTLQHTPSSATITSQMDTPSKKKTFFGGSAAQPDHLVNQKHVKLEGIQPVIINIKIMYKQETDKITDEELLKILAEAKKSSSTKLGRLKPIPIDFNIELSTVKLNEIPAKLSPELLPIIPFTREVYDPLSKDILAFQKSKDLSVNSFYRNLLYVYPKSLNLSGRPGNARNICVKMELMDSHQRALRTVFGKSSTSSMSAKAHSGVLYHNRNPQFGDEVKFSLPVDLNDGHHIKFTFMHISCKPGKLNEVVETPVAYTWHPLYRSGQLQTGDFNLPISLEVLPPSICYLSPLVNVPSIKWLDSHKPLFQVTINAVSTVHPQDEFLSRFFVDFQSLKPQDKKMTPSESKMIDSVKGIIKAPPQPLVSFLYSVLDRLLALVNSPPYSDKLTNVCFETLCHLVKVCTMLLDGSVDVHGRSQLLATYLYYNKVTTNDCLKGADVTDCQQKEHQNAGSTSSRDSVDLINVIKNYERKTSSKLLASVDEVIVEGDRKLLHEEIAAFLVSVSGTIKETCCTFSWFFLELITKSMSEYLGSCNRFFLPRKLRFRDTFLQNLHQLTTTLTYDVIDKLAKDPRQAKCVNSSLAFFFKDLLSLMDRSFTLQLFRDYLVIFSDKIAIVGNEAAQTSLMTLRVEFLRIVCSHEHFALLNLPFDLNPGQVAPNVYQSPFKASGSLHGLSTLSASTLSNQPPSPSGSSLSSRESSNNPNDSVCPSSLLDLTPNFKSKHFLLGVILSDLKAVLRSNNSVVQMKVIGLVKCLLATHETDTRLSDAALKNKIVSMYLPLIGIIMDIRGSLFDPYDGGSFDGSVLYRNRKAPGVNPKVAVAISGVELVDDKDSQNSAPIMTLSKDLTQQLLICLLWTIKNIDKLTLRHWLRELSPQKVHQFVELLQLSISCFEHESNKVNFCSASSSAVVDASNACVYDNDDEILSATTTTMRKGSSDSSSVTGVENEKLTVKWRFDEVNASMRKKKTVTYAVVSDTEQNLEKQLSTEACLVVVDTMETLLKVLNMPASDHLHFIRPVIVRLLMHILACNQSTQSLDSVFATQRSIVANYSSLIFEERTELCAEFCLQLLRHLSSKLAVVRSNAAASLYLLMRQAYEHSCSFSKVKMQITMSLSTLVSNSNSFEFHLNEANLRKSLKTLLTYLDNDMVVSPDLSKTTFGSQVKDLVFNLHMILTDTVKMKNISNDFEMLIDLMFRIAKGYQSNPDLRLTWLINIANKHAEKENYAEAAQCIIHCAALVSEYLLMKSIGEYKLPKGAASFQDLSENILEESAVSDDIVSPNDEGICESAHFSVEGFIHLVEKAAHFLEKSQMYELLPSLYKLIIPLYEQHSDYSRLSQIHQYLADQLKKVDPPMKAVLDVSEPFESPLPGSDKRCFGTYFRIGFYGYRFGDLNGEEFVYKEPAITKLSEVSHRLDAFYSERLGRGNVEVIKDSSDVDPRRLNPEKAYVQITYVEPYLEAFERRKRDTHFQCNYKLNTFVYATPFTKDGRAHGELKDQFKRRTILTVQNSFPYLKTRLRVVNREQTVLAPIEVAIEDIQKKTRELTAATVFDPPDAKMLQMVLQGCIGTTVNLGPVQIARVFLAHMSLDERGKPKDKLQNKLRLCFKDFVKKCGDALHKNEVLISSNQADYQKELRRNYSDLVSQLKQIIGPNVERIPFAQIQVNAKQALQMAADMGPVTAV